MTTVRALAALAASQAETNGVIFAKIILTLMFGGAAIWIGRGVLKGKGGFGQILLALVCIAIVVMALMAP